MQVFEFAGRGSPPFDGESSEIECEFKLVVDDDELSLWNLGLLLVDIFYLASWIRCKMVLIILATISSFQWIFNGTYFVVYAHDISQKYSLLSLRILFFHLSILWRIRIILIRIVKNCKQTSGEPTRQRKCNQTFVHQKSVT